MFQDIQPRVLRVFISSTFRDMQAERDELIKFIFPQIRKLCEERGVIWSEVDLRWGITEEQKSEGKVLPICLSEIHRCRPYFIGLLGERYGWIPEDLPKDLLDQQPWLVEHAGRSVTELEILHGVLNDPAMESHAYFYFRDPQFIQMLPEAERNIYKETPAPEEIKKYGEAQAWELVEERKAKLHELKERIKKSDFPLQEKFNDPKHLGRMVLDDLTKLVDRLFPPETRPDPIAREVFEQHSYIHELSRIYIGGERYLEKMEEHFDKGTTPLVITGRSGSGKSALLANWIVGHFRAFPDEKVIYHFMGSSSASADVRSLLTRLIHEFNRVFSLDLDVPQEYAELKDQFSLAVQSVSRLGGCVLVIDALNQLFTGKTEVDLTWLPNQFPENVKVYLSTLPGPVANEFSHRAWENLEVQPMSKQDRREFLIKYLSLYSKSLDEERIEFIISKPQCQNPLYLKTLLDELRQYGVYEEVGNVIKKYLAAPDIPALYDLLLERCENDFEIDRSGLVADSLSYLWAARRGLSEAELLDLLGKENQPLPHAIYSPFYLAIENALLDKAGLYTFSHEYFRAAVEERYLDSDDSKKAEHLKLADYFEQQEESERRLDELAWQLCQGEAWQRLADLLADPAFFSTSWYTNDYDVQFYWSQIEQHSLIRMVDTYQDWMDRIEEIPLVLANLASLFYHAGYVQEYLHIQDKLAAIYKQMDNPLLLGQTIGQRALGKMRLGEYEEALSLFKQQADIAQQTGNFIDLQSSLNNQGLVYYAQNKLEEAQLAHQQQIEICQQYNYKKGLQAALGNRARILSQLGKVQESLRLFHQQEEICRELGDLYALQRALGNQGLILASLGRLKEGLHYLNQQLTLSQKIGNQEGISLALRGKALIFKDMGKLDEASSLIEEQIRISRSIADAETLLIGLQVQADIEFERKNYPRVLEIYQEQCSLARRTGVQETLNNALFNLGLLHETLGNLQAAQPYFKECALLSDQLYRNDMLAVCLWGMAEFAYQQADYAHALELFLQQQILALDLDDSQLLADALGGTARCYQALERYDEALDMFQTQIETARGRTTAAYLGEAYENYADALMEVGEWEQARTALENALQSFTEIEAHPETARLLEKLGMFFYDDRDLVNALSYYQQAMEIGYEHDLQDVIANGLSNLGMIYRAAGDQEQAIIYHTQAEALFHELGDVDGELRAMGNRANAMFDIGERQEAIDLLEQKIELCHEVGNQTSLAHSLGNLGAFYGKLQESDRAQNAFEEQIRLYRTLQDKIGLAGALGNYAIQLAKVGRVDQARKAIHEAQDLAQKYDLTTLMGQIEKIIAWIE